MGYGRDWSGLLFRIITGDDTWVHHFTPEKPQWCGIIQVHQWGKNLNYHLPQKRLWPRRVLVRERFDSPWFPPTKDHECGMLLQHPHQTQVRHSTTETGTLEWRFFSLRQQHKITHSKVPTRSDSSLGERLDHLVYSPDLTPSNFPLLPALKPYSGTSLRKQC
jgi:hypothetical protein